MLGIDEILRVGGREPEDTYKPGQIFRLVKAIQEGLAEPGTPSSMGYSDPDVGQVTSVINKSPLPITIKPLTLETSGCATGVDKKLNSQETAGVKVIANGNNKIYLKDGVVIKASAYSAFSTLREAVILALLDHKYIQSIIDVKIAKDSVKIYQPFVEVPSQKLASIKGITLTEKLNMMYNALVAIHYLHSNNICHGDIKPPNWLMDKYANPESLRLIDPELSCLSRGTHLAYTANFRAPEAWDKCWSKPADIWALGLTFYVWMFNRYLLPNFMEENPDSEYLFCLDYYLAHGPNKDLPKDIEKPDLDSDILPGLKVFNTRHKDEVQAVVDMIAEMTRFNPEHRPTTEELLNHPIFATFFSPDDLKCDQLLDNNTNTVWWSDSYFSNDRIKIPPDTRQYILDLIKKKKQQRRRDLSRKL